MLDEQIKIALKQEEAAGMSHREIGKRHHVSHTHITTHLLNGNRSISGLSIETVQKMFPSATFDLNGDGKHVGTFAAADERRILELEKKNLELDKENLELKKRIFELERQLASPSVAVSPTVSKFTLKPSEQK